MAKKAEITATDNKTITVKLPDGITVKPGKPVPIEVLEMIASHARLQSRMGETMGEDSWCIGGCVGQV